MSVLEGYEPREVFDYFEKIAAIPHGSTNTKKISDFLVEFAKSYDLPVIQDAMGNVIITKQGTDGYKDKPTVILQGHMDMVAEKEADCTIDMETEGLKLLCDGKTITADGTTLGGDDGIAVAYVLAILSSDDIPHPPIEAVFTVDEEIGMLGAAALDMSVLHGKTLINIDSEDEGIFLSGCAGGATVTAVFEAAYEDVEDTDKKPFLINITGLNGGHSGVEIDKGRANAHVLMGRVLALLKKECDFRLAYLSGGSKDNAIAPQASAVVYADEDILKNVVKKAEDIFKSEFRIMDNNITVSVDICNDKNISDRVFDEVSEGAVINALRILPNGIQRMSYDIDSLVQTSLNMGVLSTETDGDKAVIKMGFSVRSSVTSEKEELIDRLSRIIESLGGEVVISGDYPGWEYRANSPLRDHMVKVFTDMYGHAPKVEMIHAGVECGFFAGGIDDLDAISFGPDMKDIHTPRESMDIDSVKRTWDFLLQVLRTI